MHYLKCQKSNYTLEIFKPKEVELSRDSMSALQREFLIKVVFTNNTNKCIKIENPSLFKNNCFKGSFKWNLNLYSEQNKRLYLALPYIKKDFKNQIVKVKKNSDIEFEFLIDLNRLSSDGFVDDLPLSSVKKIFLRLTLDYDGNIIESNVLQLK